MNIKSFQLLKWSVSAQLEERPDLQIDEERLEALRKACDTIDTAAASGEAAAVGTDIDRETGDPVISVRFSGLFCTKNQSSPPKQKTCIRIVK